MGAEQSAAATEQYERADMENLPSILVVCGPSGVGKGTLIKKLMDANPTKFGFSVSHTTRDPRPGETDGREYHFIQRQAMEEAIQAEDFLEYAEVHGNYYGTSVHAVEDVLLQDRCCVLDIDVQGARQIRATGIKSIFVFIAPPSIEELEARLRGRGTEGEEQVTRRLAAARTELEAVEEAGLFDHVIVNGDIEVAYDELSRIAARACAGLGPDLGEGGAEADAGAAPEAAAPEPAAPQRLEREGTEEMAAGEEDDEEVHEASPPAAPEQTAPEEQPGVAPQTTAQAPPQPSPAGDPNPMPAMAASNRIAHIPEPSPNSAVSLAVQSLAPLRGKVALVTGASAGIGWDLCMTLAKAGLKVVAVARRRQRLEQLQQEVIAAGLPSDVFLPVVCDITKEVEVLALPKIVARRWPDAGVHVLVNNAGMSRNNASLMDGATASWVEMVSTNILGLSMCTREVVRSMRARGEWGHVVNICSMSGHRVAKSIGGGGFYAATKHAVKALSEGLRVEARLEGVPLRVSQVSPGMVKTEFSTPWAFGDEEKAAKLFEGIPLLKPSDVTAAVVWALGAPPGTDVNDILLRPLEQME